MDRRRGGGNFDPVVKATDPQHPLLLAEGIRNGVTCIWPRKSIVEKRATAC
jgi:hypothetical protein